MMSDNENEKRETIEDIVAELRNKTGDMYDCTITTDEEEFHSYADRIETAAKRERERDECLLFRLLWFDVEDYQSDWACNAYRQTVKDCCARLGIPYHESGKEIAEEMDKTKQGIETAREVYDDLY